LVQKGELKDGRVYGGNNFVDTAEKKEQPTEMRERSERKKSPLKETNL